MMEITSETECPDCEGGWVEYEVDYFGRKMRWGRCNNPDCRGGIIEEEEEDGHQCNS